MRSANFARLRGHYYSASALSQVSENRDSIISVAPTPCVVVGYSAKGLNLFILERGSSCHEQVLVIYELEFKMIASRVVKDHFLKDLDQKNNLDH